jgi:hypothetical protein
LSPSQFVSAISAPEIAPDESDDLSPSVLALIRNALNSDPWAKRIRSTPTSDFAFRSDELLYAFGLIYVPPSCRQAVLRTVHDDPPAGHPGIARTLELLSRTFWFPRLRHFVHQYVSGCDLCARTKPLRSKPAGLLQPLPVPPRPWTSISMDFIVGLPTSPDSPANAIWVVVDRLTKLAHFIPTTNTVDASGLASLFFNHVFRLHGLPKEIVSDRGSVFTSNFWSELCRLLGMRRHLSTAFHPQSDGQTERVNQVLEQYLRCYVNHQQNDWVSWLPLAEFCYNNTMNASTQHPPFYATYGFHPATDPDFIDDSPNPAAADQVNQLQRVHQLLRMEIKFAQNNHQRFIDKHRRDITPFEPGTMVWLDRRNLSTDRPLSKLDHRRLGPFKVLEAINPVAYRLELPPTMKIHPVFHVSLLQPVSSAYRVDAVPPPPIVIDESLEYEVSQILDSRIRRNKLEYLVDWKGYGPQDRTWEPASALTNASELVAEFHRQHSDRPSVTAQSTSSRPPRQRRLCKGTMLGTSQSSRPSPRPSHRSCGL